MLIALLFLLVHTPVIFTLHDDLFYLAEKLKENLRVDPVYLANVNLENSISFISRNVANFRNQMFGASIENLKKSKRSLSDENHTLDLRGYGIIPAKNPRDIVLFHQKKDIYAVVLEENDKKADVMSILKLKENSFKLLNQTAISNAVRVAVSQTTFATFIVVARNSTTFDGIKDHSTSVFTFKENGNLEIIQQINAPSASDVVMWEDRGNLYLTISQYQKQESNKRTSYQVDFPIYKWLGNHFDIIQLVGGSGVKRVTPFSIHDVSYLALANSKFSEDSDKIYSEILRLDVDTGNYKLHQRFQTHVCNDIKYFKIKTDAGENHFLVVGNAGLEDQNGTTDNSRSLVYKFVDNYFLPYQSFVLNGPREWLPIEIEDGGVILLASTSDGIKSFQYDGWRFTESQIHFLDVTPNDMPREVRAMHSYKVANNTILVLADATDNGNKKNMFTFTFTALNELEKEYDELLSWCLENKKKIDDVISGDVLGDSRRGDDDQDISSEALTDISSSDDLNSTLQSFDMRLSKIGNKIENLLQTEGEHTIKNNISVNHIVLEGNGILKNPQINLINDLVMYDILNNTLDMNEGFEVNSPMKFDILHIEESILPKTLNGMGLENLLQTTDALNLEELVVNGTVTFEDNLNIKGTINDMKFDNQHIVKRIDDQEFEIFKINSIIIQKGNVSRINGINLASDEISEATNVSNSTNKLHTLKVQNLNIDGFLNDLDIGTIDTYALRRIGDQDINRECYFENLEANNMDVEVLSDKTLRDGLILITGGSYSINKDVKFTGDLHVNNLTVLKYLDSVAVKDGKLDILLRDSAEMQYVTGVKSFENLELLNPIKLQGKIKGKAFDTMNPAVQIDFDLQVNDDVTIMGNVTVGEIIVGKDIVGKKDGENSDGSLLRVAEHGVKLTDAVVPIRLNFSQHINVKELFADRINNMDPQMWVVNGAKQTQVIRGEKRFHGDLQITGNTVVSNINDINMVELQTNVLRKDDDQVISGKHYVKYVAAEKKIITDNITFGERPWSEVITSSDKQVITGPITVESSLLTASIKIGKLKSDQLINNLSFVDIYNDAYTKDTDFTVNGEKKFNKLTIENLEISGPLKDHLESIKALRHSYVAPQRLQNLMAENVFFDENINNVEKKKLMETVDASTETHIKVNINDFKSLTVHGQVFLKSNFINGINLDDFENNTVKIDEPFTFDTVTLDNAIVDDKVVLTGQVENLDLDNVFQNDKDIPQSLADKKAFRGNVTVAGTVHINGSLNGANASDLCGFRSIARDTKPLILEGNVHFAKGPNVFKLNGIQLRNFTEKVWFSDKPVTLDGYIELKGNSTFKEDITVEGLFNGIHLSLLASNYLSKSRNQTVAARMHFLDKVIFEEDVASPELISHGVVNDIDLAAFLRRIILNRPQVFEERAFLEKCTAESASGNYLVNKLNLQSEVMRYDRANMISGPKRFENLDIGILRTIERNITVQDVDLNYWLANAILTSGNFRISGRKSFRKATFEKGIGLKGTMNGLKFNKKTIMSKSEPQTVTGRKVFTPASQDGIKFGAVKVKGPVNGVNIGELVNNQAIQNGENIFKSRLIFHNNITSNNVNFRSLYKGINVTKFIENVTKLGALSDLSRYYEELQDKSVEIEESLKNQAFYLNYFKQVHFAPTKGFIYPSTCYKDETAIMALTNKTGSLILNFLNWNDEVHVFHDAKGYSVNLGKVPHFVSRVTLGDRDFIYLEYEVHELQTDLRQGKLIHFENATSFDHYPFETKGTIYITSFYMEMVKNYCLVFIDYNSSVNIVCTDFQDEFHLHQTIQLEKAQKASILYIDADIFLITLENVEIEDKKSLTIWKLNNCTLTFEVYQTMVFLNAVSMDAISYKGNHFIAIANGYLKNTLISGKISIIRYDRESEQFIFYQHITRSKPIEVTLAQLPSQELVLYTVMNEKFFVYIYEGISGFSEKIISNSMVGITSINQFSVNDNHFVIARSDSDTNVLEAVFKGQRVE